MPKQVELAWTNDGLSFVAHTGTGHEITLDAGESSGGGNNGPRPTETLLVALAACGAMDVISILKKMRQDVVRYTVRAVGHQATEHPKKFTTIDITHQVAGVDIQEASVRRAIQLSISRYCPVYATVAPGVVVNERYEILDAEGCAVAGGDVEPEPAAG